MTIEKIMSNIIAIELQREKISTTKTTIIWREHENVSGCPLLVEAEFIRQL
jgi:hypothetical protein